MSDVERLNYRDEEMQKPMHLRKGFPDFNYVSSTECLEYVALQSQLKESEERLAKAEELNRVYEKALKKLRVAVEDKGPDKGAVRFIDQALAAKTQIKE